MSGAQVAVQVDSSEPPKNEVVNPETQSPEVEDKYKQLKALPIVSFKFRAVDEMIKEAFYYKSANNSMICDIIAIYLKGQKILYTEAKTLCEQRLHYLMLPTICITAICTVISVVLKEYPFGSTIVSSLNALNFFFLTLINYLKLDAKAEAHRVAAYKFDKTQSRLEFSSGKILFIDGESRELPKIISDAEKDVREIKETNQFILPEYIRYNYPHLCSINVFSEVKKVQTYETTLVNRLKDKMNAHTKVNLKINSGQGTKEDEQNMEKYQKEISQLTEDIIKIKDKYLEIDKDLQMDIDNQHLKLSRRFQLCGCLKT